MIGLFLAAAASTTPSKLHATRIVPAASKVLALRGGGAVPADLVVKSTQAILGGYAAALLLTPGLVSSHHSGLRMIPSELHTRA